MICLVLMIARCPEIYSVLAPETKLQVDMYVDKHSNAKLISWFRVATPQAHIQILQDIKNINSDLTAVKYLIQYFDDAGELPLLIDYFIDYYGKSYNYDTADERFKVEIQPFIDQMTYAQVVKLIEVTENNRQIYDRGAAYGANGMIAQRGKEVLGPDFDYSVYPHFKFDPNIISQTKDDADESVTANKNDGLPI